VRLRRKVRGGAAVIVFIRFESSAVPESGTKSLNKFVM
jgi:hypothetical protein